MAMRRMGSLILAGALLPTASLAQGKLLVAQKGLASLGIVDPNTDKVVATVPEGGITAHEVIASPDGKLAYLPIYGNSGVGQPGTDGTNMVVVDIAAQKIVGNLDFGHGVRPHCPLFGPKDGMLYVTTELDKTISVIDPKTLKIVGTIPTGSEQSHMLALSHDGKRGYTANVGPGTVSVLDVQARKTLKIIPISGNTQRIAISNDDKWVFTADQKKAQMAVIDTATDTVAKWVPLSGLGYGSAPTVDGRWLVMTIPDKNVVDVVDLKTMQVARSVDVCNYPQEVAMRPNGKTAYVSCTKGGQVAVVDLGTWKTTGEIDAGKAADGIAWAGK